MSTTRRKFLKASVLAAFVAAVPAKAIFSQSWKDRDGNPGEIPALESDPLSNYSKAAFKSYLNSVFQMHTAFGLVEVTLTNVEDMPSPRNGEAFSLLFRGGRRSLRQDTYRLTHPSLGIFSLMLVPTGSDRNGAQGFLAIINRISYSELLNTSVPVGSLSNKANRQAKPE